VKSCSRRVHPLCGRKAGWSLRQGGPGTESGTDLFVYCQEHSEHGSASNNCSVDGKGSAKDLCDVCNQKYRGARYRRCSKCKVQVHRKCYNGGVFDGEEWTCEPCSQNVKNPICVLCQTSAPHASLAIESTQSAGVAWAHVCCAVWTPEVQTSPATAQLSPIAVVQYCICGEGNDGIRSMIGCEKCGAWLHVECAGMSDAEALDGAPFQCKECKGESRQKNIVNDLRPSATLTVNEQHCQQPAPKTGAAKKTSLTAKNVACTPKHKKCDQKTKKECSDSGSELVKSSNKVKSPQSSDARHRTSSHSRKSSPNIPVASPSSKLPKKQDHCCPDKISRPSPLPCSSLPEKQPRGLRLLRQLMDTNKPGTNDAQGLMSSPNGATLKAPSLKETRQDSFSIDARHTAKISPDGKQGVQKAGLKRQHKMMAAGEAKTTRDLELQADILDGYRCTHKKSKEGVCLQCLQNCVVII